jgi:hypothetical protein
VRLIKTIADSASLDNNNPIYQQNLLKLRRLAFQSGGVSGKGLRPIVWKILLEVWPLDPLRWDDQINSNSETYI